MYVPAFRVLVGKCYVERGLAHANTHGYANSKIAGV
jgi:hypothetical protein